MKLKYFFLLLLSLYIVNSTFYITHATVRFVSKSGTSTPPYTSWQTAADSIQKCINICVDGDTIYVANGIYKENLVINTAISLIGSSMDSTVIDGRSLATITIELKPAGIGGSIENFTITGYGASILTKKIILVKNCKLKNGQYGISISGTASTVKDVFIDSVSIGVYVSCISNNCQTEILNNMIIISKEDGMGVSTGLGGEIFIKNNIILFTVFTNPLSGISVDLPKEIIIQNNLISGFSPNILIQIGIDSANINNNVIVKAGISGGVNSINDDAIVKNSILYKNNRGLVGWPIEADYNLYWKNSVNRANGVLGESDIVADPMFVNDTIPTLNGPYDFHLQKYSPAIDKGDPNILDVDGSRSDIGLFGGPFGESYTYQDLAPKPPANLSASLDSGLVHLKWNKNTEADLFLYRVYRDTVPDFVYDTTKIIAVLSDTSFYDDPPQKFISGNYYYKITAIDSAYNQSPASEEKHINITGIPEAPPIVVEHYRLLNNYPNPFNPSTTIPYRLKEPGYVKVMVYNLLGELVRVLVNQYQSAGYYEVLFHPTASERKSAEGKIEFETGYGDIVSGIYLYRIEVIGEGNIPVFTEMKKMMLVK